MEARCFSFRRTWPALIVAGIGLTSVTSAQAFQVTAEQEQACEPDAFRLCSSAIPDEEKVAACMKANEASLSPQCRANFKDEASDPSSRRHSMRRISLNYDSN